MNQAPTPIPHKPNQTYHIHIIKAPIHLINHFRNRIYFLIILNFAVFCPGHSQLNCIAEKTYFGINLAHTAIVTATSSIMNPNVTYVPVDIHVSHAFRRHFALSGLLLYRLEKDYDFFTHEVGFAIGPSYLKNGLRGFYFDWKFGVAYAFGRDYAKNDYRRTDIIVQPDAGYYIKITNDFTMAVGLGIQTLVLFKESPTRRSMFDSWDWNRMGQLAHYYLPVINVSVGFTR